MQSKTGVSSSINLQANHQIAACRQRRLLAIMERFSQRPIPATRHGRLQSSLSGRGSLRLQRRDRRERVPSESQVRRRHCVSVAQYVGRSENNWRECTYVGERAHADDGCPGSGMLVRQQFMVMRVRMRLGAFPVEVVGVLVMLVVTMWVRVPKTAEPSHLARWQAK